MSLFRHHELRRENKLSVKEEFVLGILSQFGDAKIAFLAEMCEQFGMYKKESVADVVERLASRDFIDITVITTHRKVAKLLPRGEDYLKQVKEVYGQSS